MEYVNEYCRERMRSCLKNKMILVKKNEDSSNFEENGAMSFRNVRNQYPASHSNKP